MAEFLHKQRAIADSGKIQHVVDAESLRWAPLVTVKPNFEHVSFLFLGLFI